MINILKRPRANMDSCNNEKITRRKFVKGVAGAAVCCACFSLDCLESQKRIQSLKWINYFATAVSAAACLPAIAKTALYGYAQRTTRMILVVLTVKSCPVIVLRIQLTRATIRTVKNACQTLTKFIRYAFRNGLNPKKCAGVVPGAASL